MSKYFKPLFLLAVFLVPLILFADNTAPVPAEPPIPVQEEGQDRFFQEFMNMLTTLGLIVATIFFISWFLKRMVNTRIQQVNTTSLIKIVERRALSPKTTLYVVEIYDKQLIIGETATGMSTLGEFPAEKHEDER